MGNRYSTIFKNRMMAYGLTLDGMGKQLAKQRGLEKPVSRQSIHQSLKRDDTLWKQREIEEWCGALKLDITKVIGYEKGEEK